MKETWTLKLTKEDLEDPNQGIPRIIADKENELGIFLSYYFKKEGAVAEQVVLEGKPDFETNSSGKLTLSFVLVHFNACLAIHEQAKDKMEISYRIDSQNKELQLEGPFWEERGMDEI